ncbi:MAG: DUF2157 domain-containing protein [Nitrospirae bacterium]|nr:DUF2157 domain-containing protein [Nitrospirota bacterium]
MTVEQHFIFHKRLIQEIELWLKEGLITLDQKERILARYKLLEEVEEKAGPGKLVTIISILGSILVGVGIILFIASNWSEIPRWGKLFIIFTSMITFYGLGFYLRYERETYPKVGASLIFLGSLIFGAGIFLIAQIYHITVHYPNGPLMWGLGVLPLAYLLRFKTILTLTIIDLLIWLGMESRFWLSHYSISNTVIPLITLYFMAGIALWGIGLMHRGYKSLRIISGPYIVIGIFVTFITGYILTFNVFRERLGSDNLFIFYIGIIVIFLLSIILYLFSKEKEKGWIPETAFLSTLIALLFYLSMFYDTGGRDTMILTSNLIFACEVIGIIVLGYIRQYPAYINFGLLFFVLDVVARYFDFFWKLLDRSMFFIAGGLILLLGGVILEKKRRKILSSFNIMEND